jgi:two-component system, OmpR family, KDP operon response regulator KdpE
MTEAGGPTVLLIDDEPPIRRLLRTALAAHDYRLIEASTGEDGLQQAATRQPDLIIVDLGLPDIDGTQVIRRLREWTATPIIVLSARGQERDKIDALEAGADDYVSKPFGVGELVARLRVAWRHATRGTRPDEPIFTLGALKVDQAHRHVFVGEGEIHLTPIEYRLLTTLVRHAGKVVTHDQLLKDVWGPPYVGQSHYVRVYMAQLRRKLEDNAARPRYLLTEPGVGYRLAAE